MSSILRKNLTVLVVEDDPLVRMDLLDQLVSEGYQTAEASSADEAIQILESRKDITAVFSDIEMPGTMDGIGLVAYVQRRYPPIILIVTSGRVAPTASQLPHGTLFVPKPRRSTDMERAFAMLDSA